MPSKPLHQRGLWLLALIFLATHGCDRQGPTAPSTGQELGSASPRLAPVSASSTGSQFFPLTIGNRWHYSRANTLQFFNLTPVTTHVNVDVELVGTEVLFGQEYVLAEQKQQPASGGTAITSGTRYRQDLSGLYYLNAPPGQVDVASKPNVDEWALPAIDSSLLNAQQIAECERMRQKLALLHRSVAGALMSSAKPGGTLPNEATQLQYPLRPGLSWVLREGFICTVEALEHVDLPIGRELGWRIRVEHATPPDPYTWTYHLWFGRLGMLGFEFHEEGPDFRAHQSQWLTSASVH